MVAADRIVVSIVTPTRNMAAYLAEAIESVAMQRYPHIEHIVVDGASTDGTVALLERASMTNARLRWISEPDAGQADAIRKGFALARGDVVAWLNADDIYLTRDAVSLVVDAFAREPSAAVVTSGGSFLDESGSAFRTIPSPHRLTIERLRRCDILLQPATFVRRQVTNEIPLDTTLHFAFDWDFFLRALAGRGVVVLDTPLAGYRVHERSKTIVGGSTRTLELAEVTGRYLGRRSWQFVVLRAAATLDRAIERAPGPCRNGLRRALHGGVLRSVHVVSRGAVQI
jgi:glycosyltransferase involved in cell wall biosynthesis